MVMATAMTAAATAAKSATTTAGVLRSGTKKLVIKSNKSAAAKLNHNAIRAAVKPPNLQKVNEAADKPRISTQIVVRIQVEMTAMDGTNSPEDGAAH